MSKRLIMVLALAIIVGFAAYAYAEVQNVKVSGDLTIYGIMRELGIQNNVPGAAASSASDDKNQHLISIMRLRVDADLTDNVMATVRLINDRCWGTQDDTSATTDIDLDLAYVTMKEFLYSPLTVTIGRQELHYGNGMIIGDENTNNVVGGAGNLSGEPDLDMRKAFDAIKLVLNYDPLVIDIVAAKVEEDDLNKDDDESLYGINANYALSQDTTVEGYYWLKHEAGKKFTTINKPRRVDVVGARVVNTSIENLIAQLEAAYQFGRYHNNAADQDPVARQAWALETALTYNMPKVKYTPSVTAGYAYFSGERDTYVTNTGAYHMWDPMYEDQKFGDIANAQFNQTNAHIFMLAGTAKPADDLTLTGEYYAFWWVKPYSEGYTGTTVRGDAFAATNQHFVGHEIDLKATYDYTEDVQFGLLTGVFIPGQAFAGNSRNTATEVIGSMRVTF